MPLTLYAASSNPGKLRDFAYASGDREDRATILPLPHLSSIPEPVEDAPTFAGNARIKALAFGRLAPEDIVIADDSGLEVDALAGAPGVRSARFADDHAWHLPPGASPDARNNALLLHLLAHTAAPRTARYRCVLAAARHGEIVASADGFLEGEILLHPRGSAGFGYDPLFLIPETGLTMAQLDPATRLRFSHRGRALQHLLALVHGISPNIAQIR